MNDQNQKVYYDWNYVKEHGMPPKNPNPTPSQAAAVNQNTAATNTTAAPQPTATAQPIQTQRAQMRPLQQQQPPQAKAQNMPTQPVNNVPQKQNVPQPPYNNPNYQGYNVQNPLWKMNLNNGIIARFVGNDKYGDFRENLVPAFPDEYANIHGIGGAKHAATSTIGLYISDCSKPTTIKASYNLSPATIRMLYEQAKMKILNPGLDGNIKNQIVNSLSILQNVKSGITGYVGDQALADLDYVNNSINAAIQMIPDASWEHLSQKINPYNKEKDANGVVKKDQYGHDYAMASVLAIKYQPTRTNRNTQKAEPSRYPWYIEITNGYAPLLTNNNRGTNSFKKEQMENPQKVFINLSREDFFGCLDNVVQYIELWEHTVGAQYMIAGYNARGYFRTQNSAYKRGYLDPEFEQACIQADNRRNNKKI